MDDERDGEDGTSRRAPSDERGPPGDGEYPEENCSGFTAGIEGGENWDNEDNGFREPLDGGAFYDATYSSRRSNPLGLASWLAAGLRCAQLEMNEDDLVDQLAEYARLLRMLRKFDRKHVLIVKSMLKEAEGGDGMETLAKELLSTLCRRLYGCGAPPWVLEPVMSRVAKGLLGVDGVEFVLFPTSCIAYFPQRQSSVTFRMSRGTVMHKFDKLEAIAVRLASLASNTASVPTVRTSAVTAEMRERAEELVEEEFINDLGKDEHVGTPTWHVRTDHRRDRGDVDGPGDQRPSTSDRAPWTLAFLRKLRARRGSTEAKAGAPARRPGSSWDIAQKHEAAHDAKRIIDLAADGPGFFFYDGTADAGDEVWDADDRMRALFSYLAASDAIASIREIDRELDDALYHPLVLMAATVLASASACGFWFGGGWYDILLSALLTVIVSATQNMSIWRREQRAIAEVFISWLVGLAAGLISITWPQDICFGAVGVAALSSLFQGFRIVFAVLQIMSKQTLSGAADLIEALLMTAVMAYVLSCGRHIAMMIMGVHTVNHSVSLVEPGGSCDNPIDELWYLLLVPIAAVSWSMHFLPSYRDLPVMTLHGILAYVFSWGIGEAKNIGAFAWARVDIPHTEGVRIGRGGRSWERSLTGPAASDRPLLPEHDPYRNVQQLRRCGGRHLRQRHRVPLQRAAGDRQHDGRALRAGAGRVRVHLLLRRGSAVHRRRVRRRRDVRCRHPRHHRHASRHHRPRRLDGHAAVLTHRPRHQPRVGVAVQPLHKPRGQLRRAGAGRDVLHVVPQQR